MAKFAMPLPGAVALVSLAAVAAALVSQHVFGMLPCPWCVLQRAIFVAIALACVLAMSWRRSAGRVVSALLTLLLALGGMAAALWQHFVAAKSASCSLTMADHIIGALYLNKLLPDVFAPRGSCADAAVDLLGVPYEFWSLALFAAIGIAAVMMLLGRGRGSRGLS